MSKPYLPWRRRAQEQLARRTQRSPARPLGEKTAWILLCALTGVLGWFAANAVSALENLEKLPSTVDRVYGKAVSWYHEDPAWTGVWSINSEGFMDDVELSPVDVRVEIATKRGVVDGTISSPGLCKLLPLSAYVLLEGRVVGGKVQAIAYDYIGGVRKNLFQVEIYRAANDPMLLRVKASGGLAQALPNNALIRLHPQVKPMDPDNHEMHTYCAKEREEFLNKLPGRPPAGGRRHRIR